MKSVASGEFASVQTGARQLLGERIAELVKNGAAADIAAAADMNWVKPYIEDGLAALDRGAFVSLEDHKVQIAALLASFKA